MLNIINFILDIKKKLKLNIDYYLSNKFIYTIKKWSAIIFNNPSNTNNSINKIVVVNFAKNNNK
jgi:hypothetical protein